MKKLGFIIILLGFSNLSYGHVEKSRRELLNAKKQLGKELRIIRSKYKTTCRNMAKLQDMGRFPGMKIEGVKMDGKFVGTKLTNNARDKDIAKRYHEAVQKETVRTKEFKLWNNWLTACRNTDHEHVRNHNSVVKQINDARDATTIGRNFSRIEQMHVEGERVYRYMRDEEQKRIMRKHLDELSDKRDNAKIRLLASLQPLFEKATKLSEKIYNKDGVCGTKATDSKVYNAFKEYKEVETKCDEATKKYMSKLSEVYLIENSLERHLIKDGIQSTKGIGGDVGGVQ